MSLTAKLVALGLIVAALCAGAWKIMNDADRAGYARAQAECRAAAEKQREANRTTSRQAEQKEAVRTVYRDRYITRIVKEIDREAQSLASCPLPPDVGRLLNAAAECALSDRSASCGAGDGVPQAE